MERNPFLRYLSNHREAGADALRDLFRILAKQTHPDLGARDASQFVELQEHYHEALSFLIQERRGGSIAADGRPARERVLGALYRYKSHLPHLELDARDLPGTCRQHFDAALEASLAYGRSARPALEAFDEQFHRLRAINARYPDVRVKYTTLARALCSFFDYQVIPNDFNLRVTQSYLDEIRPVTDFDPGSSPHLRHNRSAPARSALYRMRTWLAEELDEPVCDII